MNHKIESIKTLLYYYTNKHNNMNDNHDNHDNHDNNTMEVQAVKKQPTAQESEYLFRFPLSTSMTESIFEFAKIHQYDDRKQFKEKWNEWIQCDDIKSEIADEFARLQAHGFDGDLTSKLFISARYYYRNIQELSTTQKPETSPRKKYTSLSKAFLQSMDDWIIENNGNNKSPTQLYTEYCQENQIHLQPEIMNLRNHSTEPLIAKEIDAKFRKTFNNREYNIRKLLRASPPESVSSP